MSHAALVLLAAGAGTRSGLPTSKVAQPLGDRPVMDWSLTATEQLASYGPVVVVVAADDVAATRSRLTVDHPRRDLAVVAGGATRHGSERQALSALEGRIGSGEIDVVVVHDAARPFAPAALFDQVVAVARRDGGAVPGYRVPDLVDRSTLRSLGVDVIAVQTPQAFAAVPLLAAYEAAQVDGFDAGDTAGCVQRYQPELVVRHVPSSATNVKITWPGDLDRARRSALRAR